MSEFLDWVHDTRGGRSVAGRFERTATDEARRAIAEALGLVRVARLTASYRIEPLVKGRFAVVGTWQADFEQTCVASLEPFAASLQEAFEVVFAPPETDKPQHELVVDAFGEDDPEPIENGVLDVGRLVYEQLANAIDPFPRRPDAQFDWTDQNADVAADHPFAALATLRKPGDGS